MKKFIYFLCLVFVSCNLYAATKNNSELFISYVNSGKYSKATSIVSDKQLRYDSTSYHLVQDKYYEYLKYLFDANSSMYIIENAIMIGIENFLSLAEIALQQEEYETLNDLLNECLQMSNSISDTHLKTKIKVYEYSSGICFRFENYELAISLLHKLLGMKRSNNDYQGMTYTLNSIGTAYFESGNKELAEKFYKDALQHRIVYNQPKDEDYRLNIFDLILLYSANNDYANLIHYLCEYYLIANYDYDCNFSLYYGQLYREYGSITDSVFCANEAMQQLEGNNKAGVLDKIGIFYHESVADYIKAEKYYQQALHIATSDLLKGIILND